MADCRPSGGPLDRLAQLYRDGNLIAAALETASRTHSDDRPVLEEQRRTVAEEIRRGERALNRYYQAFENGDLDAGRFKTRLTDLEARLGSLRDQEAALAAQLDVDIDAGLDPASLGLVADQLRDTLEAGEPEQTKALLRLQRHARALCDQARRKPGSDRVWLRPFGRALNANAVLASATDGRIRLPRGDAMLL